MGTNAIDVLRVVRDKFESALPNLAKSATELALHSERPKIRSEAVECLENLVGCLKARSKRGG